jgi:hypothetical protein
MSIWFDKIGSTYANNFDEVEAARSAFKQQRQAVLDVLVRACESAFAGTTLGARERGKTEGGWETLWIEGVFSKVKQKGGAGSRQTAIVFGLDSDACFSSSDGGCFGFGAYLLFKMSDKRFAQLRPAMTSVGLPFDYYSVDSAAYLRSAWLRPTEERFRLDVFETEVAKLPGVFAKADEMIGAAYDQLKFGQP